MNASKYVIRFDVSVYKLPFMQVLKALNQLVSYHDCGLQSKSCSTKVHQVSQAGTQQVHGHIVVRLKLVEVIDVSEPSS